MRKANRNQNTKKAVTRTPTEFDAFSESGRRAGRHFVLATGQDDDVWADMEALLEQKQQGGTITLTALMEAMDCKEDWFKATIEPQAEGEQWILGFVEGTIEAFETLERLANE